MVTTSAQPVEVHWTSQDQRAALAADVRAGLLVTPKRLPPKWLYDPRGSELFEQITELPEYYPTRTERSILAAHAADIAQLSGAVTLIELGSGSSEKTRLLIDALHEAGPLEQFVAFDVAGPTVSAALDGLAVRYPTLALAGVIGDFERHLGRLPDRPGRLVVFLGGTIGNLGPAARASFLAELADRLRPGEHLLIGADLVKDPARLVAAYDDAAGVTAAFEKNVLSVVNAALESDFDLDRFEYVARWEPEPQHIWMGLRALEAHQVHLAGLGLTVTFAANEEIETETSAKFQLAAITADLAAAGFGVAGQWTDQAGDFSVSLARRRATR